MTEQELDQLLRRVLLHTRGERAVDLDTLSDELGTPSDHRPWRFWTGALVGGNQEEYQFETRDGRVFAGRRSALIFLMWSDPGFWDHVTSVEGVRTQTEEGLAEIAVAEALAYLRSPV